MPEKWAIWLVTKAEFYALFRHLAVADEMPLRPIDARILAYLTPISAQIAPDLQHPLPLAKA
jgi:hypothetical protein